MIASFDNVLAAFGVARFFARPSFAGWRGLAGGPLLYIGEPIDVAPATPPNGSMLAVIRRLAPVVSLAAAAALGGCGVVALPFRATGAVVKAVPVVGGVAAAPLDAAGDVID